MDQQTKVTTGTNQGTIWTRDALVQIAVRRTIMCQQAQPLKKTDGPTGKHNQLKYNFTGVPDTAQRACFNRATWNPAVDLQNLRNSWITMVMAFGGATIAQLFRMVELMNSGRIPHVMILVGSNNISGSSDEEEALWESMTVCLFTTL